MEPIQNPSLLAWGHPIIASTGLVLAFIVLRWGLAQRRQRLSGKPAPAGNLKRHSQLGPWAAGILAAATFGGVGSAVFLRGWKPLASAHGKLGVVCGISFALMWWLGRRLLAGEKRWAGLHGVLGAVSFFAGLVAGLLGLTMLP
jgi:Protein of unknown function (DUF4079)